MNEEKVGAVYGGMVCDKEGYFGCKNLQVNRIVGGKTCGKTIAETVDTMIDVGVLDHSVLQSCAS